MKNRKTFSVLSLDHRKVIPAGLVWTKWQDHLSAPIVFIAHPISFRGSPVVCVVKCCIIIFRLVILVKWRQTRECQGIFHLSHSIIVIKSLVGWIKCSKLFTASLLDMKWQVLWNKTDRYKTMLLRYCRAANSYFSTKYRLFSKNKILPWLRLRNSVCTI